MTRRGLVLDAGAFIAVERGDRKMSDLSESIREYDIPLATSAGVVAQVWRGGAHKQVPIAFLLRRTDIVDLTDLEARSVGKLLGMSGTSDPVDAHVALIARTRDWPVLTSDPDDLHAIERSLELYEV
ncbi:MAG: PIN domain-containing protein [Actinomycetota bacterium]|nr:PIN domain-containing protein [Actinomycetota bacterium]